LNFAPPSRSILALFMLVWMACGSASDSTDSSAVSGTVTDRGAAFVAGAPATPPRAVPPIRAEHVILLSLDTFRADAAGWLGDPTNSLTPSLDAFARDAVIFRRARAQIPFTQSSHMSMFTGLYPIVHRVHGETAQLRRGIPTLAEILQRDGFSTHGFYVNNWMKEHYGFGRGFDRYEEVPGGVTHADHLNSAAFATLDEIETSDRRLFLFVQYFDPHSDDKELTQSSLPYYSPAQFRSDLDLPDPDTAFCDAKGRCAAQFIQWANISGREVSPESVAQIRGLYDAGIRYLDFELGRFFAKLEESGIYDRALVIVTSDHGEEFFEHGKFLHNDTYEEHIAVPLLIKFPMNAHAGLSLDVLAESVDLLPTVLDHLEIEIPRALQGRSLLPSIRGGSGPRDYSFSQDKSKIGRFSLADARYKLIYDTEQQSGTLFDLIKDPGEQLDISTREPQRFSKMQQQLESRLLLYQNQAARLRLLSEDTMAPSLSDEEKERLRGIGYLVD
jgi:arylsulfatase A-like enzyme